MKKYIILFLTGLFLVNTVQAQENIITNKLRNSLFNKNQSQTKINTNSENNQNSEQENLSADAMILYNANDIEGALQILLSITEENRTALDWLLLGNIYQDKKDNANAVLMYQKAIIKDIKFYRAYYNLGNIYLEDENTQEAIKLYKSALKYKPDFGYGYYNIGCAYVKIGNLKKAKSAFLKAAEYKKEMPETYYNLVFIYKKLGDTKKAEEYLKIYNELAERKL